MGGILELPCLIDDRYRVDRSVGQGGFGHVYSGIHLTLGVRVAVKVLRLRPGLTAEHRADLTARFLEEGRLLTRLRHPNIVAALDLGLLPPAADGSVDPYLVMEWVDGTTLDEWLKQRGQLSISDAWALFEPIVEALACAHDAHVVHRDLKPSNVMVVPSRDGRIGVPRVIDFGVAKVVSPDEEPGTGATETASPGSPFTPAYAAPEQITQSRTGPWTDVHALGLMFFELVIGAPPYGTGINGRLAAVALERPTPAKHGVDVGPFEAVLARAVALNPRDRFPNAKELLEALRAAASDGSLLRAGSSLRSKVGEEGEKKSSAPAPKNDRTARTLTAPDTPFAQEVPGKPGRAWTRLLLVPAALITIAIVGYASKPTTSSPPPTAILSSAPAPTTVPSSAAPPTFNILRPRALTLDPGCEQDPVFLPDGSGILYAAQEGHNYQIYRLDFETKKRTALTRGDGERLGPDVSPDGRYFIYLETVANDTWTYEAPLDGSTPPRKIGEGPLVPRYSPDGKGIWSGANSQIKRRDRATLEVTRTLTPPSGNVVSTLLELPDGRVVAMTNTSYGNATGILLYGAEPKSTTTWLLENKAPMSLLLAPDGNAALVTVRVGPESFALWRLPFDGSRPVTLPTTALVPVGGGSTSTSKDRIVWSTCQTGSDLTIVDPTFTGELRAREMDQHRWRDESPRWLRGTDSVVVRSNRDGDYALWVVDPTGVGAARKIDTGKLIPDQPGPSQDGRLVAFSTMEGGLYIVPTDGSGAPRLISTDKRFAHPSFSSDDQTLFFEVAGDKGTEIAKIPVEGGPVTTVLGPDSLGLATSPVRDELMVLHAAHETDEESLALLDTRHNRALLTIPGFRPNDAPSFSPDGKRVAIYSLLELAEYDLVKRTFVRRLRTRDSLSGLAYTPKGLVVTRSMSSGDLWLADLR
jgi:serine/threonine protein kinase/Tol biopolymer transport system component